MDLPSTTSPRTQSTDIHDRVARVYYSHGLFCSSHPYAVIFATLAILAVCCYPLLHLPLLGSSSQQFSTPFREFIAPGSESDHTGSERPSGPRWFQGPPVGYIQQVIVKSAVSPWKPDLVLIDAFRAPLSDAFHITELINNHQIHFSGNNSTVLSDLCLQVSEPLDNIAASSLPHYGCLLISPTNVWNHDSTRFQQDTEIIKTIFRQRDSTSDSSNFREILFGVPWKETGIKKLFARNRPRVITYAVTIVFKTFNEKFLHSLFKQLRQKYPSNPYIENITYSPEESDIAHIHFQDLHTLMEFVPLGAAYIILFLYIYFSFCKIELVKSKWALAICAVMTVLMSLLMSIGLCLWFGLNPTLSGSGILPYLIVVIGLENMLVLTKSVVSTPVHLDVKLRIAQGLSKEGWSITKNLFTELALLTVAFLTFVPKIQEFCLFAVVGLLTDFFLQLVFFATFLSIDIRRMEVSDLHKSHQHIVTPNRQNVLSGIGHQDIYGNLIKSSSSVHAKLLPPVIKHKRSPSSSQPSARIFAPPAMPILKLPRRMRFIYFWARTRMVQRGLMICVAIWIMLLFYKSGLVEQLTMNSNAFTPTIADQVVRPILHTLTGNVNSSENGNSGMLENKQWKVNEQLITDFSSSSIGLRLKHSNVHVWQGLSPQHWTRLFGYYNISLSGRYISVLPRIHLSAVVDPSVAIEVRNSGDVNLSKKFHWQFLSSGEQKDGDIDDIFSTDVPYHPSSPAEVALAIALAIPSLLFLVYFMVVLYRCMCTRHYAEWRSSWRNSNISNSEFSLSARSSVPASDAYLVMETLPIQLHGHSLEIENIVTDSNFIVSSCLTGDVCFWDAITGECLTVLKRSRTFKRKKCSQNYATRGSGSFSSDSTYSSSPSDSADYFSSFNASAPVNSTSAFSSGTYCSNPVNVQFSFEGPNSASDVNVPSEKYDFSKFVVAEDTLETDCKTFFDEVTVHNDYFKSSCEQDIYRESSREEDDNSSIIYVSPLPFQAIWSVDFSGCCIAIGCGAGRLELWNAFTGKLEYVYEENRSGIVMVLLAGDRLVAARLSGVLDFFAIEIMDSSSQNCDENYENHFKVENNEETFHCIWLQSIKAHTLAVSTLEIDAGLVVSGGFDRLVKVFRCDSALCIYTLHGHTSPISALKIDELTPSSAASGCQDGLICLWDLMTGTCMYSLSAHHGAVITLQLTNTYVVSQGADNRICIWEKCQGHLLHNIQQDFCLCSNLVLLTSNIMVTTKEDNLVLWDVNHGEALRMIMVGKGDHSAQIQRLRRSGQSIVCDYGSQMFIINFPAVSDKTD